MLAKASVSRTAWIAAFLCFREARRRRHGIGSLQRQRRLTEVACLTENDVSREARQRWESDPPADRYALQRLMPGVHMSPGLSDGKNILERRYRRVEPCSLPSARTATTLTSCSGRVGLARAWRAAPSSVGSWCIARATPRTGMRRWPRRLIVHAPRVAVWVCRIWYPDRSQPQGPAPPPADPGGPA